MNKSRVILTGFMGTGKSAIGVLLAGRLGYDFLDTDAMVEVDQGKSIPEIFEKEGEAAFRQFEKMAVQKALARDNMVISTGGGAVIDPESRDLMKQKGIVICLSASPDVILQRTKTTQIRPLLDEGLGDQEKLEKIKNLLSQRSTYYADAHLVVDTTYQSIEKTVEVILELLKK